MIHNQCKQPNCFTRGLIVQLTEQFSSTQDQVLVSGQVDGEDTVCGVTSCMLIGCRCLVEGTHIVTLLSDILAAQRVERVAHYYVGPDNLYSCVAYVCTSVTRQRKERAWEGGY